MNNAPGAGSSWVADEFGITVGEGRSPVGLTMAQLIQLALRRNPRRAQLLVSTVLGKHLPADPRVVAGVGRLLGALVARTLTGSAGPIPPTWPTAAAATVSGADRDALLALLDGGSCVDGIGGPVLTLGFAETATSLGHLVADQLGSVYLHSTRHTAGAVPVAAEFAEPHSHAIGHLLRPDPPSLLTGTGPVVLIDDELSTGRTALNVIEALHVLAPRKHYVLAGLVDLRSDADDGIRAEVAQRLGCRIDVISLVRGSITVPPDARDRVWAEVGSGATDVAPAAGSIAGAYTAVAEPEGGPPPWSRVALPWPADVPTGGRHGFTPAERPAFENAVRAAAATVSARCGDAHRILVVGTEELMYLPLMIALELARDDQRSLAFQSTTRSPVHAVDRVGYPIRRRIDFTSTDDGRLLQQRHLYNAGWPAVDGDDGLQEADLIVIVEDGHVTDGPGGLPARVAAVTDRPVLLAVVGATAPTGAASSGVARPLEPIADISAAAIQLAVP